MKKKKSKKAKRAPKNIYILALLAENAHLLTKLFYIMIYVYCIFHLAYYSIFTRKIKEV